MAKHSALTGLARATLLAGGVAIGVAGYSSGYAETPASICVPGAPNPTNSIWAVSSDGNWCTRDQAGRRITPRAVVDPVEIKQQPTHGEISIHLDDFGTTFVGSAGSNWKVDSALSDQVAITVSYRANKGYVGQDTFSLHYKGSSPGDPGVDELVIVNVVAR